MLDFIQNGDTLMILAAKGGKQELLKELFTSRADLNKANPIVSYQLCHLITSIIQFCDRMGALR